MEFIESFMKFSFSDDDIFRIEEDELVKDVENVKACECVVLISENVALIEATALENKLIVAYIPRPETAALRQPDGSPDVAKVQAWFTAHEQQSNAE